MFEKENIISEYTGKPYTKFNYTFNENEPIVGVLFGHYAPFTGPNGHGRLISSLKKIGAKYFLIATPNSNKPFDDEREMFSPTQRVEIINKYLKSENLNGKAIKYDMCRGGAKSQIGPLVKIAAEEFGMNIRPVLCFGPDREDLASEVCNKFGEIKNPNRCEYIIDYDRGTSGTEVRKLIRAGDVDGIMKATGYKKEVAEYLIELRNENIKKYKLEEAIRGKVEIDFANIYDANEFKQEMEDRFEDNPSAHVTSNFRLPDKINESTNNKINAFWYYKGCVYPINEDDFHFTAILRDYEEFDLTEDYIKSLFEKYGFNYEDFKNNREVVIEYFSRVYFEDLGRDSRDPTDLAEELLQKVHKKGAIRVRATGVMTYITCATLDKKTKDNILNLLLEYEDLFEKNKPFVIEKVCEDKWNCDQRSDNFIDLLNNLAENDMDKSRIEESFKRVLKEDVRDNIDPDLEYIKKNSKHTLVFEYNDLGDNYILVDNKFPHIYTVSHLTDLTNEFEAWKGAICEYFKTPDEVVEFINKD